ncbi:MULTISPECIES: DUF3139 domain-containing protein [unclassified Paenibacillus]|uniref:DUF3139 domain-containing protein n=1 Tax=unclassified Paenibacillus TaxID=185978 RepID=UPI00020D7AB8|nr:MULTISPECIES: DUF3139 domain-containing protein [unclassified Paenibacillus]EGL16151.1 hypothetical protein HMPREF9413_2832 [Paenibacillus sp. HGF7]EPD90117.1 hypothetical protein HMPREF1207_01386 [Paenibacillus sp. HGH0039]
MPSVRIKKSSVIIGTAILLLALSPFAYSRYTLYKLERGILAYLTETKHYQEEEILSIEAKISKMPKYPIYVKFTDEPDVTYLYIYRDDKYIQAPPGLDSNWHLILRKHTDKETL